MSAYKPWEKDPTLHRCVTCGSIRYYGPETMHCVICEKLIMKNRDPDEIHRLLQAGEFDLRQIQCSFGVPDDFGRRVQHYPICGDCIRREKDEEEEMNHHCLDSSR
jgi:hypothetical protein